ncbi:hypothetical protein ACE4V3_06000 (plasmid) [Borrelia recurrentis]|uniref:hypothetical protein n=1 Tax=Borrelia recurrentis TaxID=44449 RepID=UPI00059AFCE0|nr:hypothetical protein [Borrelia recurrentis]
MYIGFTSDALIASAIPSSCFTIAFRQGTKDFCSFEKINLYGSIKIETTSAIIKTIKSFLRIFTDLLTEVSLQLNPSYNQDLIYVSLFHNLILIKHLLLHDHVKVVLNKKIEIENS